MKLIFKKNLFLFSILLVLLISLSVVSAEDTNLESMDNLADTAQTNDCLEVSSDDSNNVSETSKNIQTEIDSEDDLASTQEDSKLDLQNSDSVGNNQQNDKLSASGDSYHDVYVESVSQKYNNGNYLYLGWQGYFSGYFKVYDSDSYLVYSEYIGGSDKDLCWSLDGLSVDTYTAGLVSSGNNWIKCGTIQITKSSSKISVKTYRSRYGIYFYAYVKDKYTDRYYDGGKVKLRINGRNYYATLNDGVAVIKFKPPKKNRRYKAKFTFLGGSNVYASSKTIKIKVKKRKYYVYKTKYKYKVFNLGHNINGVELKYYANKGYKLVKYWYGSKMYYDPMLGHYYRVYGKFKKTYRVKKAKYAYY